MARVLGAAFQTQMKSDQSRPYLVLQVDWQDAGGATNTVYYLDRDINDLNTDGDRAGTPVENRVLEWGELRLELNEGGIGGADEVQVVLSDSDKAIKALLELAPQQRRAATLYRMFDDATVTWSQGKEVIFGGTIMPYQWDEAEQSVTITIANAAKRLTTSVGKAATRSIFPRIPEEHEDKILPIVWGKPRRVPAVPVQFPWATVSLDDVPAAAIPISGNTTVNVLHHPDDMGLTPDTQYQAFLGTDRVAGFFTQSTDKLSTPSTFTIDSQSEATLAVAQFSYHGLGSFSSNDILVLRSDWNPKFYSALNWFDVDPSNRALIWNAANGSYEVVTVTEVEEPGGYSNAWVRIGLDRSVSGRSGTISLLDVSTLRRQWPAGTAIQARGTTAEVKYIFSMLPVTSVQRVEGFGTFEDEGGRNVQGFVSIDPDFYEVNVSDDTWFSSLGHNVGTITFKAPPRFSSNNLAGNDIFVTCTQGDIFTSTVVSYFTSDHLFSTSFGNPTDWALEHIVEMAAAGLNINNWAYVQTVPRRGLDVVQEIALLGHSILLADQGSVQAVLLSNEDPGTYVAVFDENNITEQSLLIEESSVDDLVSHLLGDWTRDWDGADEPLRLVRFNTTVRDTFGDNHRDFAMTGWRGKDEAEFMLDFWLTRWTKIYRTVTFETFLDGLICQPGDWIKVSFTDGEGNVLFSNKGMEVQVVSDQPGGSDTPPVITIVARYDLFSY